MTNDPFQIAFLIFPGMTQLDFTGPAEVLGQMPDAKIVLVSTSLEPVYSDNNIAFVPHATITDDVTYNMICVPGGVACTNIMMDEAILNWLREQAETAEFVTSVCTGSLVLAAAGLLYGYNAGCHWAFADHLKKFGATPVRERVVIDRNRITAGGVTAGIDFGFRIVEKRLGRDIADAFRLGMEYDPEPQTGGVPETARPEILERVRSVMSAKHNDRVEKISEAAAALMA